MSRLRSSLLRLHREDDVAVVVDDLSAGMMVSWGSTDSSLRLTVREFIPTGHKVALRDLAVGAVVKKYGQPIGRASQAIFAGDHVHSHNLSGQRIEPDPVMGTRVADVKMSLTPTSAASSATPARAEDSFLGPSFLGYRRENGQVGTRNTIAVISSVNCSATVAKRIAAHFTPERLADFPYVDAVVAYTHGTGCGLAEGGTTHTMLARTLGGIMRHPNVGGLLLVGLGCEQATTGDLVQRDRLIQIGEPTPLRNREGIRAVDLPQTLTMQQLGGTRATIAEGIRQVEQLLPQVNQARRERVSASQLIVGLECGGSDAWSGITANPAVGCAADRFVAAGASVVLAETPEIYGAEHLLSRRAESDEVAAKLMARIRWWENYTARDGVTMDNNPSTGNKAGGLTTIAEKSLGAVAKGGSSPLVAVVDYAERITTPGLTFMDTPGYDPASVTGLMAGGANIILFTTGRGSCFGSRPAPTIKIATNTPMFERLRDDMDLDAGPVLNGVSLEHVGQEIFDFVLKVASGQATKSELLDLGENEFVPWTVGPTL